MKPLRTVMIVIRETGANDGKGFDVFLGGDTERIGKVDFDQLSPAEFWGHRLFVICANVLRSVGVGITAKKDERKDMN